MKEMFLHAVKTDLNFNKNTLKFVQTETIFANITLSNCPFFSHSAIYIFLRAAQKSSPSVLCGVTSPGCVLLATCWAGKPALRVPVSLQMLAQNSTGGKEKQSLSFEKRLGKSILGIFKRHHQELCTFNPYPNTNRCRSPGNWPAPVYCYTFLTDSTEHSKDTP